MRLGLLLALACFAPCALADAYKCIGDDGRVSYSFVPCPVAKGDTEWARKVQQAQWVSVNPEDAKPDVINKRATDILRASYRTKVHYTVHYLPGVVVPPPKKHLPRPKPMRCLQQSGQTQCDGLARP
ncbi:DUF4124 domain-containing protein [Pseudomonas sp. RIT-PI-S]|uniref:DUF4124 domain-containing protein n=1 Tax=Pseudomonas sp. RIT-PI-S TaxID=3035295 RepID=UPI0021D8C480|nr:DUF4124 domain-containing protein [Pseudomonas sp. RIT-PI-S]